jgi:hypothetical protein
MGMKPRHKGRSYWGGVQAPSQFSPLLPAPCPLPLLTKSENLAVKRKVIAWRVRVCQRC